MPKIKVTLDEAARWIHQLNREALEDTDYLRAQGHSRQEVMGWFICTYVYEYEHFATENGYTPEQIRMRRFAMGLYPIAPND